jgi:hypothetical protein
MRLRPAVVVLGLAALGLAALGCEPHETPPSPPEVRVQPSAASYQLSGLSTQIDFTVLNDTPEAVYLVRCGPAPVLALVEQATDTEWTPRSGACVTSVDSPTKTQVLAPGRQLASQAYVSAGGTYRLRVGIGAAAAGPFNWTPASPSFAVR